MAIFLKLNISKIILFFIFINILISFYLCLVDLKNQNVLCTPGNRCDYVLKSEYSKIKGIPISLIGFIYFIFLFMLITISNLNPALLNLALIFSSFSFIFSLYLIYLQIYIIKALCPYCLVVDVSSILIFFLLIIMHLNKKRL